MNHHERIAKVIARRSNYSRRQAEQLIADSRVKVDGNIVESPGLKLATNAVIHIDGEPLPAVETSTLWLFHKPKGVLTTRHDPQGRETVYDRLPDTLHHLITVGRLDYNTEGLLLLTNDGDLARYLELPSTGWKRSYRVRAHGKIRKHDIRKLEQGIEIDGIKYKPTTITIERQQGANCWLRITLTEGKNREIRKLLSHIGLEVNRLIRTSYGAFHLGKLPANTTKQVPQKILEEQLGSFLQKK